MLIYNPPYSGYGVFYFSLVTLPLLFGPIPVYGLFSYQWNNGNTGLSYISIGIGSVTGIFLAGRLMSRSYVFMVARLQKKSSSDNNSNEDPRHRTYPEARLPFLQVGIVLEVIGLVIFAWTVHYRVHWIVPLIAAGIFAIGIMISYISIQTYLVDTYRQYAASALAAAAVLRSVLGCVFSIVGFGVYKRLGYDW